MLIYLCNQCIDKQSWFNIKYGLGADNGFKADFDSLEAIPNFVLGDKTISEIVSSLSEEEIFY